MERLTDIGTLLSRFQEKEETVVTRFHGIDRHKKHSTVSVLDREWRETRFLRSCQMKAYPGEVGPEDVCRRAADRPEASCGSFYWADRVEATCATCFVPDPMRFRIITDSWNETDGQDARDMAKALWVFLVTGVFGIPTVHKPSQTIRPLRRLLAGYKILNRQIRMLKDTIEATIAEDGPVLRSTDRSRLFKGKVSVAEILPDRHLSEVIVETLQIQIELLRTITESKDQLGRRIVQATAPLNASAFLADVGDVHRFPSLRRMNADLGHIIRESRKLSRNILTQSIYQTINGTPGGERGCPSLRVRSRSEAFSSGGQDRIEAAHGLSRPGGRGCRVSQPDPG